MWLRYVCNKEIMYKCVCRFEKCVVDLRTLPHRNQNLRGYVYCSMISNQMSTSVSLENPGESSTTSNEDVRFQSLKPYLTVLAQEVAMSEDDALELLSTISHDLNLCRFTENLKTLKRLGVSAYTLSRNPLLCSSDNDCLHADFELFSSTFSLDIPSVAPLVEIRDEVIDYIKVNYHQDLRVLKCNRFHYFCKIFQESPVNICLWIKRNTFMLGIPPVKIIGHLKFARKCNIAVPEIMLDPQFFRYSASFIENRHKKLCAQEVKNVRAWMLCSADSHIVKIPLDEHQSRVTSLSNILQCNENVIDGMFLIYPLLQNVKIEKVLEICHIFEKEGLPRSIITRAPLIVLHKTEKISKRLAWLRGAGLTSKEIEYNYNILLQNEKRFTLFLAQKIKAKSVKHYSNFFSS